MTILDDDAINMDFNKPTVLNEKLKTLNEKLPAILSDFKKYYVFFNKNPEYPEYQNHFENIKGNLTEMYSSLFMLSNEVDSSTQEINKKLNDLNELIQKEKNINSELKSKVSVIENKSNASIELISDYKLMYNSEYLRNWALFLSILIIGTSISKINNAPVA